MLPLAAGLLTLLLGLAFTPLVRAAAHRLEMVAWPRDDRWHRTPTALLGGVAIYSAFAVGFVALYLRQPALAAALPILGASTIVFAAGLLDDVRQVGPLTKLAVQLVAAAIVVLSGLHLPWTLSPLVNDLITILWLVGLTNAINLLDNMDGLAAGISAIACLFLAVSFALNGQHAMVLLPALLGGASLGFLFFNFKPASIFMGDCGAMFLGSAIGGLALLSEYGRSRSIGYVILTPVLIMTIPILDTCLVTITRRLSGRRVSQGGRDHTSHRLVALGASERRAVLMLYALAGLSGLFALAIRRLEPDALLALVPGFGILLVLFALYLGTVRIDRARGDSERHGRDERLTVSKRQRLAEVALDIVVIVFAYYAAYLFRFDWVLPADQRPILIATVPIVLFVEMGAFLVGGLYRQLWRYARIEDLLTIAQSTIGGGVCSASVVLLAYGFHGPSRAVLLLNVLLLLVLITASRLSFRLFVAIVAGGPIAAMGAKPVLIYGAGESGVFLARAIIADPCYRYVPVGFLDTNVEKVGRRMHGLRIFAPGELAHVVRTTGVDEILVSNAEVDDETLSSLRGMGLFPRRIRVSLE